MNKLIYTLILGISLNSFHILYALNGDDYPRYLYQLLIEKLDFKTYKNFALVSKDFYQLLSEIIQKKQRSFINQEEGHEDLRDELMYNALKINKEPEYLVWISEGFFEKLSEFVEKKIEEIMNLNLSNEEINQKLIKLAKGLLLVTRGYNGAAGNAAENAARGVLWTGGVGDPVGIASKGSAGYAAKLALGDIAISAAGNIARAVSWKIAGEVAGEDTWEAAGKAARDAINSRSGMEFLENSNKIHNLGKLAFRSAEVESYQFILTNKLDGEEGLINNVYEKVQDKISMTIFSTKEELDDLLTEKLEINLSKGAKHFVIGVAKIIRNKIFPLIKD